MSRELLQQALDALESLQGGCTDSNDGTVEAITVWCPELIDALRSALAAPQPEPEKRIVWCTETDSACSTCPTLRIPCQAATQAAALNARVTVPREPTQEMIAAGEAVFRSYCFRHVNGAIPTYEAMIAAVPAPAAPPPIDNRFVAPGCEQFGTRADAESLLTMLRATLDEYMRLAAAPAVREPQDERIRWRDAVIKDAEGALRVAQKEFDDAPVWANAGHAANKVAHALAVIAALGIEQAHGIGGGGNG